MTKRLMTPNEYVNACINAHPILYAGRNVRMIILDQLFNVLGNGINNFEEAITKTRKNKIRKPPEKYTDGSQLFMVYLQTKDYRDMDGNLLFTMPEGDCLDELITEEEKVNYPGAYFIEKRATVLGKEHLDYIPYPNFDKNYSILWTDPNIIKIMPDTWKDEAYFFYEYCLRFFSRSDMYCHYHSAAPVHDESKMTNRIAEQEKFFIKYRTEGMTDDEYFKEIETKWNHPYDGDTRKFIITKWEKERHRTIKFIQETLELIRSN